MDSHQHRATNEQTSWWKLILVVELAFSRCNLRLAEGWWWHSTYPDPGRFKSQGWQTSEVFAPHRKTITYRYCNFYIKCVEVYNCCSHGYFTEWSGALGNTEQLRKSSLQCPISTSCISLDRTRQPRHTGACIVGTCIPVLELWP